MRLTRAYSILVAFALSTQVGNAATVTSVTFSLDPKSGFLRTQDDPGALNAPAIRLSQFGFAPGDSIRLTGLGSYDRGGTYGRLFDLIGVFSESRRLLPGRFRNRVPDAIPVGPEFVTVPTNAGNAPTDITQDFLISNYDGYPRQVDVTIPQRASFLFVGTADAYYSDNSEAQDWGLEIRRLAATPAAVPLPTSLAMLAGGLGIAGLFGRARKKTR